MRRRALPLPAALSPGAVALVVALALTCAGRPARAEDLDEGVPFRSIALQANPLGVIIGRYSADLEYLPAPHHALHLTPLYYYALPGTADQLTGPGAEIGYRFYSGWHGPHGFFGGLSALVAELEYIHSNPNGLPFDRASDTLYVQLGAALDFGYQVVVLGSFAVGVGVGVQYTVDTLQPQFEYASHPWHDLFFGAGLRPRALLQVGTAF